MKHVLFLDHAGKMGGAEYSLFYLIKYLDKNIIKPHLVTPEGSEISKKLKENNDVKVINNDLVSPKKILEFMLNVYRLSKLIKSSNISIVHCNTYRTIIYGIVLKITTKAKIIWHVRDFYNSYLLKSICSFFSDNIVCISEAIAKQFRENVTEKITVVYNGVDFSEYNVANCKGTIKKELGISNKKILVGMVGRIDRWKGIHYFIKAASKIINQFGNNNYVFVVVGDSILTNDTQYKNDLINLVNNNKLNQYFYFLGQRSDIPNVMASLDLSINYSEKEPFGRVIIESLAMGTPVIVNNTGGAQEIIKNIGYGNIIPSNDDQKLAESIMNFNYKQNDTIKFINKVKMFYDARIPSEKITKLILELN